MQHQGAPTLQDITFTDTLVKEWLLFRGFMSTLTSFSSELACDRSCGFQAEAVTAHLFARLIPQLQVDEVMEVMEALAARVWVHAGARLEGAVRAVEAGVVKALMVGAVKAGRPEVIGEVFRSAGAAMLAGPGAGSEDGWRGWAALAFLPSPATDPLFAPYFTLQWRAAAEVSLRNLLHTVLATMPRPALLLFADDRRARRALAGQVEALTSEVATLKAQLSQLSQLSRQSSQQPPASPTPKDQAQPLALSRGAHTRSSKQAAPEPALPPPQSQAPPPPPPGCTQQPHSAPTNLDRQHPGPSLPLLSPVNTSTPTPPTASRQLPPPSPPAAATAAGALWEVATPRSSPPPTPPLGGGGASPLFGGGRSPNRTPSPSTAAALTGARRSRHHRTLSLEAAVVVGAGPDTDTNTNTVGTQASMQGEGGKEAGAGGEGDHSLGEGGGEGSATTHTAGTDGSGMMWHSQLDTSRLGGSDSDGHCHRHSGSSSSSSGSSVPVSEEEGGGGGGANNLEAGLSHADTAGGARGASGVLGSLGALAWGDEVSSGRKGVTRVAWHAPGALHRAGTGVRAVAFSPSGTHAASGSDSGEVAIWEVGGRGAGALGGAGAGGGGRAARFSVRAPVTSLSWDARADKVMLVGCGGGRGVRAWHVDTRRVTAETAPDPSDLTEVTALACSNWEPLFACATSAPPGAAGGARLALYNLRSFKRVNLLTLSPPHTAGHAPSMLHASSSGGVPTLPASPSPSLTPTSSGWGGAATQAQAPAALPAPDRLPGGLAGGLKQPVPLATAAVTPEWVSSPAVTSLCWGERGAWLAAGTTWGVAHVFDGSGRSPAPLHTLHPAAATSPGASAHGHPVVGVGMVGVPPLSAEPLLVTHAGAGAGRLYVWSLRKPSRPLAEVTPPMQVEGVSEVWSGGARARAGLAACAGAPWLCVVDSLGGVQVGCVGAASHVSVEVLPELGVQWWQMSGMAAASAVWHAGEVSGQALMAAGSVDGGVGCWGLTVAEWRE